jgi:hypothetical protein
MTRSEILAAIALSEAAGNSRTPIPNHVLRAILKAPLARDNLGRSGDQDQKPRTLDDRQREHRK